MSYLKDREIWLSNVPTGNPPTGYFWKFIQNGKVVVRDSSGNNQIMVATSGSQAITGSLTVTGGITGTVSSASYVEYSNVANKPTLISGSSQITYSGLTGIPSGIVSGSAQIASFGIFATTGSNGFNGNQSITGSLTVTGQVVAQTLNVQQVTSSIVYSSGSNIFGNSLANTQQFTGSVSVTGSFTVAGAGTFSNTLTLNGSNNVIRSGNELRFNRADNAIYTRLYDAGSLAANGFILDNTNGEGFHFQNNGTTIMRMNSSGNVGIGTNSPSTLLHLSGSSASIGRIVSTFALSSGYSDVVQILNPNQTGGGLSFNIGKAESTRNLGKIVYAHSSDGSTSNRLAFGFYDADNLLNLTAGGRVGIGTTSPDTLLHVRGYEATNWISTQTNTGTSGHVMYFGYNNNINTTYGLYITGGRGGVEQLDFAVENKFYVNGDGKVGVGTGAPDAIFHIAKSTSGGVGGQIVIDNPASSTLGNTSEISFLTDAGASGAGTRNARILAVNENVGNGAANMQFHTWNGSASAERMRIHANGAVTVKSGSQPTGNGLHFYFNSDISKIESLEANIAWRALEIRSSQTTFDTGGNERMRITSGGNVGIGTSSPLQTASNRTVTTINGTSSVILNLATGDTLRSYIYADSSGGTLEALGNLSLGTNGSFPLVAYTNGSERLRITTEGYLGITVTGDTISAGDLLGVLSFVSRDASTYSSGGITNIRSYATTTYNTGNVAGDLRFYVSNGLQNTTGTYLFGSEAMRVSSGGTLYIGTDTNPMSNATPLLGIVAGAATDAVNIKHTQDGNNTLNIWQTGNTSHSAVAFYKGNTQDLRGTITVTTSGTTYNSSSDYRLKENIVPIENGIDRLMQLKPSKFNWIETGNEAEGFIAHELQEIFPDAVTGEKDAIYSSTGNIKPQSVDYGRITPLLVKAIQEQQTLIESLKSRIEILEQ